MCVTGWLLLVAAKCTQVQTPTIITADLRPREITYVYMHSGELASVTYIIMYVTQHRLSLKKLKDKTENLHAILLPKKECHGVSVRCKKAAYCCLKGYQAMHFTEQHPIVL